MVKLYPFIFKPILKEVIWGGEGIRLFKGMPPVDEKIGESWELSHIDGYHSVVANGALAGRTIENLIEMYGDELLGRHVMQRSGKKFPLLIKFIDACKDLSIQVHPNDDLARQRHGTPGKTEMWYIVKASHGAVLYSGFTHEMDADEYVRRIADNNIVDVLQSHKVEAGDVFFLPAGRVHSIGAGCFIVEIQQTSDVTYRIYDYDRRDANGNLRELHTDLAKDAIDYTFHSDSRINYTPEGEATTLAQCQYFTTNLLNPDRLLVRNLSTVDSFAVYICIEGMADITDDAGNRLTVVQGQTVLFPATTQLLEIVPQPTVKMLETYIE